MVIKRVRIDEPARVLVHGQASCTFSKGAEYVPSDHASSGIHRLHDLISYWALGSALGRVPADDLGV